MDGMPRFVFLPDPDQEYFRTGEIITWMGEHCLIRMDRMNWKLGEKRRHLHSILVSFYDLEYKDGVVFFHTRAELTEFCKEAKEAEGKPGANVVSLVK